MSSQNPFIAAGCKGAKDGLCNLNEFIEYISKEPLKGVAVTTEEFPDVESAVVQDAKKDYAVLVRKVGEKVTGKLDATPINKAELELFQQSGKKAFIAMDAVLKERGKAAIEKLRQQSQGRWPERPQLSRSSPSSTSKEKLQHAIGSSTAEWAALIEVQRRKEAPEQPAAEEEPKRELPRSAAAFRAQLAAAAASVAGGIHELNLRK
ncbi:hypothetical protein ISF_09274 [Cordyceps fumosorosea ARSEF 2679]|uniref:Uncharacterized protein n=1 Tax=Cordyceps fumosorosea (strain ARSEF 2679) TaxID=1081104 RepID=A0A167LBI5_CORFA|nr:hypothetical protein ISF_09274 [Cordyceps fumosorosea ARSEF 2679]OAA52891.1 hypothetical protein ISF_09274 [Cordyceps fumosorosea ARSEF 2679]